MAPGVALASVLMLVGWTSCQRPAPVPAAAAPCAAVQGELAVGSRAAGMEGSFTLSLVATSGPRAGSTATGSLRLRGFGSAPSPIPPMAGTPVRYPLFGGTSVSLAEVGALAPGDVTREDAAAPGVLAIESEQDGAPRVTLRMGADANHGTSQRFDGSRMALFVTSITPERFAGRWESGGGDQRASGHFCAVRV